MAEGTKQDEDKLGFTLGGETPGYISLDQTRVLAPQLMNTKAPAS